MTHYEERLEADAKRIRMRVRKMGASVQEALRNATQSVLTRDVELAADTILGDLPINRRYRKLDSLCHVFVARHLPSAGHLRFVSAVMRLSKTMERIGDYAETISRAALQLTEKPPERIGLDIEMMSQHSLKILEQSLRAFDEDNAELARGTLLVAGQYGTTFDKVFADLISEGEKGKRPIADLFNLLAIFNRLERVIHQSKNICEQTLFAVLGETKDEKAFDIIFVDEDNSGASLLAEQFAKKAYPEGARFESAGWEGAAPVNPVYVAFAEEKGLDVTNEEPRGFASLAHQIQDYEIVIDLTGKARKHLSKVPFHTTLVSWRVEDRENPEAVYKQLAPKLNDLMARLHGEQDA